MKTFEIFLGVFAGAITLSSAANAAFAECQAIADPMQRLACYDKAANATTPSRRPPAASPLTSAASQAQPAQLPAPATAPPPVAKAAPPVAPPAVASVTPPAAQAPSSPPPEPVPPAAPQTSPVPSPPIAEPTVHDEAVDVEAQRREKALALAERLREEENTPANETMEREREARRRCRRCRGC